MSGFALQQAVFAALTADSAVTAPVYDFAPRDAALPCIVIGEGSENDWSTKTESGSEHLFTIQVWSRAPGMKETKTLAEAVRAALDGAGLGLSGLVDLRFLSAIYAREGDGRTLRATLRFRAITES